LHEEYGLEEILVFGGVITHPDEVYVAAEVSLQDYKHCKKSEQQIKHSQVETERDREIILWRPPPTGFIKINWDASINKKDGCIGGFLGARSIT
jgi:hypothetical protein